MNTIRIIENIFPRLQKKEYIARNRIETIKIFLKTHNDSGIPIEIYAYRFDYYSNGFLKLIFVFNESGNIIKQIEFDVEGNKIKMIENNQSIDTFQFPDKDTTIYEYRNNLLIREQVIKESNYFGIYKKELLYLRDYKYELNGRLVELIENYIPTNSYNKKTYEYPSSDLKKEFDYAFDGELNSIKFYKYDINGFLLEERAISSYQYEDTDKISQMYKHLNIYNNGIKTEIQIYDNTDKLESTMKYHYDSTGYLKEVDIVKNEKLFDVWRFEYKKFGFINSIFKKA